MVDELLPMLDDISRLQNNKPKFNIKFRKIFIICSNNFEVHTLISNVIFGQPHFWQSIISVCRKLVANFYITFMGKTSWKTFAMKVIVHSYCFIVFNVSWVSKYMAPLHYIHSSQQSCGESIQIFLRNPKHKEIGHLWQCLRNPFNLDWHYFREFWYDVYKFNFTDVSQFNSLPSLCQNQIALNQFFLVLLSSFFYIQCGIYLRDHLENAWNLQVSIYRECLEWVIIKVGQSIGRNWSLSEGVDPRLALPGSSSIKIARFTSSTIKSFCVWLYSIFGWLGSRRLQYVLSENHKASFWRIITTLRSMRLESLPKWVTIANISSP